LLSQRGRAYPDQNYTATHGNDGKSFPIVVLVNRNTASAAEIVSGALQDHDRALYCGRDDVWQGAGADCLQPERRHRPGADTYHYYNTLGPADSAQLLRRFALRLLLQPRRRAARRLDQSRGQADRCGPHVYGGGGIAPDEKIDSPKNSRFQDELLYKDVFFHFAPVYLANRTVDKDFQVDEPVMSESGST